MMQQELYFSNLIIVDVFFMLAAMRKKRWDSVLENKGSFFG